MMISSENMLQNHFYNSNPTIHIPSWSYLFLDQTVDSQFPLLHPYNIVTDVDTNSDTEFDPELLELYSSDQFRMFDFKVRMCTLEKSHDWTDCPYAHPGEKARRRDPRKVGYSGTACSEYRKGICKKGDGCEFGHGVFECWLHPNRYRTQVCKDGLSCKRRVCFFAHTPEQLRNGSVLSPRDRKTTIDSYDGSPLRNSISSPGRSSPVKELVENLRQLQLSKVNSLPNSWRRTSSFGSPRASSLILSGFSSSMPTTPTRIQPRNQIGYFGNEEIDEPVMERVESGRDLRAKMLEKLRNENALVQVDPDPFADASPDFGWVSDLVM